MTAIMELDFHQLDRRYEALRARAPSRERRLVASLSELGQQAPVIVVAAPNEANRYVLVDGYKRLRALCRLHHDTVEATCWALGEAEALLLDRLMRSGGEDSALEQGWLLRELRARFGLTQEELARRFDKSQSWVNRRLSLVSTLPEVIQRRVQQGEIVAHGAMKYLVPMARANCADCVQLANGIAPHRVSSRQLKALYEGWTNGDAQTRARIVADPMLYLRALAESRRTPVVEKNPLRLLLNDLSALGAIARRADRRLQGGVFGQLESSQYEEIRQCFLQSQQDVQRLSVRVAKEIGHARRDDAGGDPAPA